jgi:ABC-type sugar transport system ATPase subunit
MHDNPDALALEAINKSFTGVRVLQDIDLSLRKGETRALIGENGAGKSTLIKLIAGVYPPDSGRLLIEGRPKHFRNPLDAYLAGVAVVHQETSLVPTASVLQNIFLGRELLHGPKVLDERRMLREYEEVSTRLGVSILPNRRVAELGAAEKKLVEILKAFARRSSILILDEPTDSLSRHEIDALFAVLMDLKSHGVTMIYITHFLGEVGAIADSVTVLRDGRVVADKPVAGLSVRELVSLMLGREPLHREAAIRGDHGKIKLSVCGLGRRGEFSDVTFDVRKGEVLGIIGVVGSGKTELARALSGASRPHEGEVFLDGKKLRNPTPRKAIRAGIGMAPEDRKSYGLILDHSVLKNVTLASLDRFSVFGVIRGAAERKAVAEKLATLSTKYASLSQRSRLLSGGNQQKLIVARWLMAAPDILVLDEPTRGVDVGAKAEIHAIVRRIAAEGKSVIYCSGEALEILAVADRVVVMQKGRVKRIHEVAPPEEALLHEMLEVADER